MSKNTAYHSTNGRFTGKSETTRHSDGSKTVNNYKATGDGWNRTIFGPSFSKTSTTKVDNKGNSRTTTPKKSSWW